MKRLPRFSKVDMVESLTETFGMNSKSVFYYSIVMQGMVV